MSEAKRKSIGPASRGSEVWAECRISNAELSIPTATGTNQCKTMIRRSTNRRDQKRSEGSSPTSFFLPQHQPTGATNFVCSGLCELLKGIREGLKNQHHVLFPHQDAAISPLCSSRRGLPSVAETCCRSKNDFGSGYRTHLEASPGQPNGARHDNMFCQKAICK